MPIYRGDGGSGDATTDAYASEVAINAEKAAESAKNANKSAQDAEAFQLATQALYDDFDKRYLGPKAAEPTTDNKGDPLETGALFFSTTDDAMYVYNGTVWRFLGGSGGAGGIQLGDLSVTVNSEGVANLEYNNTNGVFTYTPPDLSSYVTSSDVSGYGFITADSSDTLTNKSGNISQWTNDSGYITAGSSDTLTNKAGNISQWTNDSGYITGNETITLTGAVTGSGTTSIATTLSTIDGGSY